MTALRSSEVVANRIRAFVATERLVPGDRLGREEDLAREFGVSWATVMAAVREHGAQLLQRARPGASATAIGGAETAFMRAGMLCKDKQALTLEDLEKIANAAIEGIQARGGALPGDKTLIDVLIPVREAIGEHARGDGDNIAALRDATAAAEEAAERAKSWVAKRGRQQFTGDRSSGTPDPGMVAVATILADLCTEFGVSRTAVSA